MRRATLLSGPTPAPPDEPEIVHASQAMRAVCDQARRLAAADSKVFISGESGVGKDLLARYIHLHSPRSQKPFLAVNCGGLSDTLLESELFGHVRGAFTGAYRDKLGKLQMAQGGTIFMDEVGEMTLRMQTLLLRFLENGEIQSVGSDRASARVDVRVIAATNKHLDSLVATGHFREDLLYRIRVLHIIVPPLRNRRDDIRPLVAYAVRRLGRAVSFSEAALQAMEGYPWPGNVRELQNVVEQLVCGIDGDVVQRDDLPSMLRRPGGGTFLPAQERRRQVADDLYDGLVGGTYTFWEHIHGLFLGREITRHDLMGVISRGLSATHGNYKALVGLFGMNARDYKRLMNFLAAHECVVDFREFRTGTSRSNPLRPRLPGTAGRKGAASS